MIFHIWFDFVFLLYFSNYRLSTIDTWSQDYLIYLLWIQIRCDFKWILESYRLNTLFFNIQYINFLFLSIGQVIPPGDFKNNSKSLRHTYKLLNVVGQKVVPNSTNTGFQMFPAPKREGKTILTFYQTI